MNLPDVGGRVLDVVSPLDAEGESWTDRDYGPIYCTVCGDKSEIVTKERFVVKFGCPNSDCTAGREYHLTRPVCVAVSLAVVAGVVMLPALWALLLLTAYFVGWFAHGTLVTRLVEVIR